MEITLETGPASDRLAVKGTQDYSAMQRQNIEEFKLLSEIEIGIT